MKSPSFVFICALSLSLCVSACTESEPVESARSSEVEQASDKGALKAPEEQATKSGETVKKGQTKTPAIERVSNAQKVTKRGQAAKTPEVDFEGKRIALIHTANVVGELEPCG